MFELLPVAAGKVAAQTGGAARPRAVQPNSLLLERGRLGQLPARVQLPISDGEAVEVVLAGTERMPRGGFLTRGQVVGQPQSLVVMAGDGTTLAVTIHLPGRATFLLTPSAAGHQLEAMTAEQMPPCATVRRGRNLIVHKAAAVQPAVADNRVQIVDVLVAYTAQARDEAGSEAAMNTQIDLAVEEANTALANSRVQTIFRCVHRTKVHYVERGILETDLDRLTAPADGQLDELLVAREKHQADLVCLITASGTDAAGIAWVGPDAELPFSVVRRSYLTGSFIFAHELAHCFGCQHDRPNALSAGVQTYSYGHVFTNVVGWNQYVYGTVMAYPGYRIPHFSNPAVSFLGHPTGVANVSDNARTLNEQAATVAAFRGAAFSTLPPTVTITAPGAEARVDTNAPQVALEATAADSDGTVRRVEFYQDGRLVGTATNSPWRIISTNALTATNIFTAKAVDDVGASTWSAPLTTRARPLNDEFANRQLIQGTNSVVTFNTLGIGLEPGDPLALAGGSLWFTWTAPMSGWARLVPLDGIIYRDLAVFTGESLGTLTTLATGRVDLTHFPVLAGTSYQISLADTAGKTAQFRLEVFPELPNDRFEDRTPVAGTNLVIRAHNVGATLDVGETAALGSPAVGRVVWWSWTPPPNSIVTLFASTGGVVSIERQHWVFRGGNLTNLTFMGGGWSGWSGTAFRHVDGSPLAIAVGTGIPSEGWFDLVLTARPALSNDSFTDRIPLSGTNLVFPVDIAGATREPGEPTINNTSAWWTWTAPADGQVKLESARCSFGVFTGSSVDQLTFVAGKQNVVSFRATRGVVYQICADYFYFGGSGQTEARLTVDPVAPNDLFNQSEIITGTEASATHPITWANRETGEPDHAGKGYTRSLWWQWTAPATGELRLMADVLTNRASVIAVYTGGSLTALAQVATATRSSGDSKPIVLSASVTNGVTYRIAVDGDGDPGQVNFKLRFAAYSSNVSFANRTSLAQLPAALRGTTYDPNAFVGGRIPTGRTLWWSWTPPTSGWLACMTNGGDYSPVVQVFLGTTEANLRPVLAGSNGYFLPAGAPVNIAVSYSGWLNGPFDITASFMAETESFTGNDGFQSAASLGSAIGATLAGSTWGAGSEFGEPAQVTGNPQIPYSPTIPALRSRWWRWQAPANGQIVLRTAENQLSNLNVRVFTGTQLSQLQLRGGADALLPVRAGESFAISVDTLTDQVGTYRIELTHYAPPGNNMFVTAAGGFRLPISGVTTGTLLGATWEEGEPLINYGTNFATAWWSWQPMQPGLAVIVPQSSHIFEVFTGGSIMALTPPSTGGWHNNLGGPPAYYLVAPLGQPCFLRISSPVDGTLLTNGSYRFETRFVPAPTNDHFASRAMIQQTNQPVRGTTLGATGEGGELGPLPHSVWYSWRAPAEGLATITGSFGANHQLLVFEGNSVTNLTAVSLSGSAFRTIGGREYQLRLGNSYAPNWWPPGADHDFQMGFYPVPANDHFANRLLVQGTNVVMIANTGAATREPDEPVSTGNSVWWTWTAPSSGRAELAPPWLVPYGIFTGTSLTNLTSVATYERNGKRVWHVRAGDVFQFSGSSGGEFRMELNLFPPPPNDEFTAAAPLGSVVSASFTGNNSGATREPGEPVNGGDWGSLWWTWQAPSNGWWTIKAGNALSYLGALVRLGLYTGDAVQQLTPVAAGLNEFKFEAVAGTTYRLACEPQGYVGDFAALIVPTPANDEFAGRLRHAGIMARLIADSTGALRNSYEPGGIPGGYAFAAPVWWSFVPSRTTTVRIKQGASSAFAPYVLVYTGSSVSSLVTVAEGGMGNIYAPYVDFAATAGQEYHILAGGGLRSMGRIHLEVLQNSFATNDHFAATEVIPAGGGYAAGMSGSATREAGEPLHGGLPGGRSLWWNWTAPESGSVEIDYSPASIANGPLLGIYTGAAVSVLAPVAAYPGRTSRQRWFDVVAGTTYRIAMDGLNGGAGFAEFLLNPSPRPANDDFARRLPLPAWSVSGAVITNDNTGATLEPGEPLHAGLSGGRSVWWSWVAPTSGVYAVSGWADSYLPRLGVYEGTNLASLTPAASSRLNGLLARTAVFEAAAGREYNFALGSSAEDFGRIYLSLRAASRPPNDAFGARTILRGSRLLIEADNAGATREADELEHAGKTGGRSLWWSWTARVAGPVIVSAPGNFDSLLAVYTSLNGTKLVLVAADDDGYGGTNRAGGRLTFSAQAGTTYHVAVDGFAGAAGAFTLSLEGPPFPAANLGGALRLREDDFRFRILGTPDQTVVLQASTNLVHWQNVSTNVLAESELEMGADPRVSDRGRFYRLLSVP